MSPQTNYSQDMAPAVAGLQVDGRHDKHVVSPAAEEVVPFGLVVVRKSDDFGIGRLPGANQVVVTEDAGTYTAGDIVVTINGQTITEAFDTDKATTLGNLATTLAALGFVTSAVYSAPTLTIIATADVYLSVAVDVSGITGTMTISGYAHTSSDPVLGLSLREVKSYGDARNRANDTAVCTLAGDALAANDTITGTVNGVAIATVTYATSEAVTLQLLADELMKNSGVALATVSGRVVTVLNNAGLEIQIALTVTDDAVASVSPSFSYAYSKQSTGVTLLEVAYLPTETISALRKGSLYVLCEENVSLGDTPYVRVATGTGSQRGAFRNDADSGSCQDMSASFSFIGDAVQDPDGNYVAPVEVNLP
jgi:hypothetical protein